ncbi:hypothetical protein OHA72_08615 [Dactylosporangium sp. NBC_01737]|uniref:hypothetical protein n=1 Tax=Dactylosporangium sp. NBC_01737 TaxID=2975959 RepID=UPI002E158DEF|nr:hypothetical protein OHA72_08615 [Dactylosporangium sp. NBC_01737]
MDLTQAMLAATEHPPPTSIDVDQLITGERRRTRRLHSVTGIAVAVALTAAVLVVPQYLRRTAPGQSPGVAPPATAAATKATSSLAPVACVTPVATGNVVVGGGAPLVPVREECGAALARLDATLTALLTERFPDITFTNMRGGEPLPARFVTDPTSVVGYSAGLAVPGGGLAVTLRASEQTPAHYREFVDEQCGIQQSTKYTCRGEVHDGAQLLIRTYPVPPQDNWAIDVWSVRPDGTMLFVTARGDQPGVQQAPFDVDQLIALVTVPELTLYP